MRRRLSPTRTPDEGLREIDDGELAMRILTADDRPDSAAESELYRRYVGRLVAFGRRRLGTGDHSVDLAQDTILLTIEKLRAGAVREPGKVGAFILGVARSLAGRRRLREARVSPLDELAREPVATSVAAPDPIAHPRIRGCLEALPETQRTIVVLTFYAEQSSRDIAGALGLSPENVRVIRHRGVASLRACLGRTGEAA